MLLSVTPYATPTHSQPPPAHSITPSPTLSHTASQLEPGSHSNALHGHMLLQEWPSAAVILFLYDSFPSVSTLPRFPVSFCIPFSFLVSAFSLVPFLPLFSLLLFTHSLFSVSLLFYISSLLFHFYLHFVYFNYSDFLYYISVTFLCFDILFPYIFLFSLSYFSLFISAI